MEEANKLPAWPNDASLAAAFEISGNLPINLFYLALQIADELFDF